MVKGGDKKGKGPVVPTLPNSEDLKQEQQQLLESMVKFTSGASSTPEDNLANSVLVQPQVAALDNKNPLNDACVSSEHQAFCRQHANEMVEIGNEVLRRLYSTNESVGTKDNAGELIQGLTERLDSLRAKLESPDSYTNMQHQTNATSWVSPSSWIKSVDRVLRGNENQENLRNNYMLAVNCVMWALYNQAAKDNQHFSRGSYKLVDDNNRLYEFFKGYAKFAAKYNDPGFSPLTSNDLAYSRNPQNLASSHYTNPQFKSEQYGLDFRLWEGYPTLEILPHKHSHLLFGQVEIGNKKYTFLKPEQIGLGSALEFLEHSSHFLQSGSTSGVERREKDIPNELKQIFSNFRAQYNQDYGTDISVSGISDMYHYLKNLSDNSRVNNDIYQQLFKEFVEATKSHNLSDLDIRTGNEVILKPGNKEDISSILPLSKDKLLSLREHLSQKADELYPSCSNVFQNDINKLKLTKNYDKSICDDLSQVKTSELISKFYPYPIVEGNRDQLAIDVISKYDNDKQVSKIINCFQLVNNALAMNERISNLYSLDLNDDIADALKMMASSNNQGIEELKNHLEQAFTPDVYNATFSNYFEQEKPKRSNVFRM